MPHAPGDLYLADRDARIAVHHDSIERIDRAIVGADGRALAELLKERRQVCTAIRAEMAPSVIEEQTRQANAAADRLERAFRGEFADEPAGVDEGARAPGGTH